MTRQEIMVRMDRIDTDTLSTLVCKCGRNFTWKGSDKEALPEWVYNHMGCIDESDPPGLRLTKDRSHLADVGCMMIEIEKESD